MGNTDRGMELSTVGMVSQSQMLILRLEIMELPNRRDMSGRQVVTVRCTGTDGAAGAVHELVECWNCWCCVPDRPCLSDVRFSSQPRPRSFTSFQPAVDLEVASRNGGARVHVW